MSDPGCASSSAPETVLLRQGHSHGIPDRRFRVLALLPGRRPLARNRSNVSKLQRVGFRIAVNLQVAERIIFREQEPVNLSISVGFRFFVAVNVLVAVNVIIPIGLREPEQQLFCFAVAFDIREPEFQRICIAVALGFFISQRVRVA